MKKITFVFILILLCLLPFSVHASEQFSYSFETPDDALMWSGGVYDDSNASENGFFLYVNNPFGEVRNDKITHVLDYAPTIRLEGGKVYTISGYTMNPVSSNSPSLRATASRGAGANTVIVSINGIGDEWGFFSTTFFAGESGEYNLSLQFAEGNMDFGFFVDELKLEEISCTLSSLNISGPDEIIIPASGSIKNYYRPFLLTTDNQVVDILSDSNLHFTVSNAEGVSFDSRNFALTINESASSDSNIVLGCALRNFKDLTPASIPILLSRNIIDNSDFSYEDILWKSTSDINSHTENKNRYISVPMDNYGGTGYYTTLTYSNSQLLHKGALYVIRARVKSDNSEKLSPVHAKNIAEIYDATLYFTVTDISGDDWIDVFAAFIPEEDGIYDIALNLCSQSDCTVYIDDITLSCEDLAPEYITMHAPGNITLPNAQTSYPFSALLRDQLGNIIPTEDVSIEISPNDGSFYFDSENNRVSVISFSGVEKLEMDSLAEKMKEEWKAKEPGYELAMEGYMRLIFSRIIRKLRKSNVHNFFDAITPGLLEYIDANFTKKLTLSELANKCFYNPAYLGRAFKNTFNVSLHEYINEKRVTYAKKLLIETDETVGSIGSQVGYADEKQFFKVFKSKEGYTPKQYRELKKTSIN